MAATRLIAMHKNKGKTILQCLKDRTDYAMNGEKTNSKELVSSYACLPETVEQEFYDSKEKYLEKTGRVIQGDIIAYQIRQSFKPGEVTPEEANRIGYETAMRWTKGNNAFLRRKKRKEKNCRRKKRIRFYEKREIPPIVFGVVSLFFYFIQRHRR